MNENTQNVKVYLISSTQFLPHYYSKCFYSDTFYKRPDFSLQ